jgi:DNA primase
MDGDQAGRDGTVRWVDQLTVQAGRPVLLADLPTGCDPADWLTRHGPAGLALLDPARAGTPGGPRQPGPEIVRAVLARTGRDPTTAVTVAAERLLASLPDSAGEQLAAGVVAEMTRQGWNPDHTFTKALAHARREHHPAHVPAYATGPSLT